MQPLALQGPGEEPEWLSDGAQNPGNPRERRIMDSRVALRLLVSLALSIGAAASVYGQHMSAPGRKQIASDTRQSQLVEANIIATHAYQVLLPKRSGRGDPTLYSAGKLSDSELEALVAHQAKLLKSKMPAVNEWVRGAKSDFDPARDLNPILASALAVPEGAPVNVFAEYLFVKTNAVDPKNPTKNPSDCQSLSNSARS